MAGNGKERTAQVHHGRLAVFDFFNGYNNGGVGECGIKNVVNYGCHIFLHINFR
jgi:hypothetical protein